MYDDAVTVRLQTQWQYQAPNGDTVPLMAGMPLCAVNGRMIRARADSFVHSVVCGMAVGGAPPTTIPGAYPNLPVLVNPQGLIELDVARWVEVTGDPVGLIPDAVYYLGISPGTMSTSPPQAPGLFVVQVGLARSATIFSLRPVIAPILL